MPQSKPPSRSRRMPTGSVFYERVVPLLMLVFAVVLVLVLVVAVVAVVSGFHL